VRIDERALDLAANRRARMLEHFVLIGCPRDDVAGVAAALGGDLVNRRGRAVAHALPR
jgi:hypothetical protein